MCARSWLSLALVCFILGCGGGGGGSNPAPTPPVVVAVPVPALFPPTAAAGALTLQWLPANASIDGYELETRTGTAPYQKIHTGLLAASSSSYDYSLPAASPETADFYFRIRALRGSDSSLYSNEVRHHKPLNSPSQLVGQFDWDAVGVALSWTGNSTLSDGITLKRAECTSLGTVTGAWVVLETPAGSATTFLDKSAKLDLYYVYAVANLKGKEASAETASVVISTFVPSPTLLTAIYDPAHGGVSLTCTDAFSQADGVVLERAEAGATGTATGAWVTLSTPTGPLLTFLDQSVQEGTSYIYRISNLRHSAGSSTILSVKPVMVPPTAPGQLAGAFDWNAGGVALAWTRKSAMSDGIAIKRAECTSAGTIIGPWVSLEAPSGNPVSFLDTSAKLNFIYAYAVANLKGQSSSADCAPVVITTGVPAPALLTAVYDAARGGVSLSCTSAFSQADGMLFERAESGATGNAVGTWIALATPAGPQTSFLDQAVQEGTSYVYRVSNLRQAAGSPAILSTSAVTVPPSAPSGLVATYEVNQGALVVSWTGNSLRNTGVQLERTEADAAGKAINPWVILTLPAGMITTHVDRSAQEFTTYIYRATNLSGSVKSAVSAVAPAVTTPLATPTITSVTYDAALGGVSLDWKTNSTHADGVVIERASCDLNGYPTTMWSNLYANGAKVTFVDRSASELTRYLYRISNLRGQVPSTPSAPSMAISTPLAAPSGVSASYSSYALSISVYWYGNYNYNASRTCKLERAECDVSGIPTTPWVSLSLPPGNQSSYADSQVRESTRYLYRVANVLDQYTTPFAKLNYPVQVPLLAPTQLVATSQPGGVNLSWQNQSQAATQVIVRRIVGSTSVDAATLPATSTTYADTGLPLGTYGYVIVAKNSDGEISTSRVDGTTLNRPDSLSLSATAYTRSSASDACLRPGGQWAFAQQSPFEILSTGDPWTAIFPNTQNHLGTSLLKVDSQDHPHSVFLVPSPTDPAISILRHLWHDGTSWITEDLMQGTFPESYYNFGLPWTLDSTGRPQVLVNLASTNRPYGGTIGSLSYVHYSGGTWKTDSLSTASNATATTQSYAIALDAADQPHILVQLGTDGVELLPTGPGAWSVTTLTSEPIRSSYSGPSLLDSVWRDADNGWLFYLVSASGPANTSSLRARQKLAGVWQAPVTLGIQSMDSYGASGLAGMSSDRSKLAVLFGTNVGLKAYHLDFTGWHETLIDPSSYNSRWYRLGFDSSNKIRILYRSPSDSTSFFALSE